MTVQELIDILQKIPMRDSKVFLDYRIAVADEII